MNTIMKVIFAVGVASILAACGGKFIKPDLSENGRIERMFRK